MMFFLVSLWMFFSSVTVDDVFFLVSLWMMFFSSVTVDDVICSASVTERKVFCLFSCVIVDDILCLF